MEKESNSFLILTLMTTSKWSHKQALGSAEVPKGKKPLETRSLYLLFSWVERNVSLKAAMGNFLQNPQRRLADEYCIWNVVCRAHFEALKVLNSW